MARARRLAASGVSMSAAMWGIYRRPASTSRKLLVRLLHVPVRHVRHRQEWQPLLIEGARARRADRLFVQSGSELGPALEIEGLVLLVHRLGRAAVEQDEGAPHAGDVHRLVQTVEDQYARREHSDLLSV